MKQYADNQWDYDQISEDFTKERQRYRPPIAIKLKWLNYLSIKPRNYIERAAKHKFNDNELDDQYEDSDEDVDIEILEKRVFGQKVV